MRVAVIGAGGFIGQRATEWLHLAPAARGVEVVPVVRSHATATRIARLGLPHQLADAMNVDSLARAIDGCDVVFDTVVGDAYTIEAGPGILAAAARRAGVRRVVYLSTGMVYGYRPTPADDDETAPRSDQPRSYNKSKAIAEERIIELRRSSGVEFVTLRPTIVYGPRSELFTVRPAHELLRGEAFLVDRGEGICNAVYVDNLVQAMWLGAVTPAAANETFVVSDRERVTWAALYESVATAVGVDPGTIRRVDSALFPADYGQLRSAPVRGLLGSRHLRGVRARLPERVKSTIRGARGGWATRSGPVYAQPSAGAPDPLFFVLQTARHQFPIAKAERVLGYNPLPFSEAARRTGTWLQAMGFRADSA